MIDTRSDYVRRVGFFGLLKPVELTVSFSKAVKHEPYEDPQYRNRNLVTFIPTEEGLIVIETFDGIFHSTTEYGYICHDNISVDDIEIHLESWDEIILTLPICIGTALKDDAAIDYVTAERDIEEILVTFQRDRWGVITVKEAEVCWNGIITTLDGDGNEIA